MSPPSRGRGLKQCTGWMRGILCLVAPFTGAWIETSAVQVLDPFAPCRPLHGGVD